MGPHRAVDFCLSKRSSFLSQVTEELKLLGMPSDLELKLKKKQVLLLLLLGNYQTTALYSFCMHAIFISK